MLLFSWSVHNTLYFFVFLWHNFSYVVLDNSIFCFRNVICNFFLFFSINSFIRFKINSTIVVSVYTEQQCASRSQVGCILIHYNHWKSSAIGRFECPTLVRIRIYLVPLMWPSCSPRPRGRQCRSPGLWQPRKAAGFPDTKISKILNNLRANSLPVGINKIISSGFAYYLGYA